MMWQAIIMYLAIYFLGLVVLVATGTVVIGTLVFTADKIWRYLKRKLNLGAVAQTSDDGISDSNEPIWPRTPSTPVVKGGDNLWRNP